MAMYTMDMQNITKITLAWKLHTAGMMQKDIAAQLNVNRDTLRIWFSDVERYGLLPFLDQYIHAKKGRRHYFMVHFILSMTRIKKPMTWFLLILVVFVIGIRRFLAFVPKYPDIAGCPSYTKKGFVPLTEESMKAIFSNPLLFRNIPVKEGYTLGWVRVTEFRFNAEVCLPFFTLGIKENSTNSVLEGDDGYNGRFKALVVTKENLALVGELLYGKPNNYPGKFSYFKTYMSYLPLEKCKKEFGTNSPLKACVRINEKWPEGISDGDVTQDVNGTITLHRFILVGPGLGGVEWLEHNQIHIDSAGDAKFESIKLAELDTGISY